MYPLRGRGSWTGRLFLRLVSRGRYLQRCTRQFIIGIPTGTKLTVQQPPTWNLTINDTSPIFFYCSAPGSCIDYQMVGAINPVSCLAAFEYNTIDLT
jgi:hypothetical protein